MSKAISTAIGNISYTASWKLGRLVTRSAWVHNFLMDVLDHTDGGINWVDR